MAEAGRNPPRSPLPRSSRRPCRYRSASSSDAEWLALICALKLAQSLDLADVAFMGDAAEVIQQANRALITGRARHAHAVTLLALTAGTPETRIRWIKREQNLAGIALAARHPR